MTNLPTKAKFAVLASLFCGAALFAIVNFAPVCHLHAVTLNDEPIEDFRQRYGLDSEASILHQPLDSLVEGLLNDKDVVKVDIEYRLPDALDIVTNRFTPVCFVLDKQSNRLFGLTDDGRVVPIPGGHADWEHPVIANVAVGRVLACCPDDRIGLLVKQLRELRADHADLYRLIAQIDLAERNFAVVTISGLPYRLKLTVENFQEQLKALVDFLEKFSPDLGSTVLIDMRFRDMIVNVEEGA
jgi:hypothetical protein